MGTHAPILQSAALPYRISPHGVTEVLLVSTTSAQRWGIPKGAIENGHTFASSAAKEAFEEAGVEGDIAPGAVGHYRAIKRTHCGRPALIEVWVHLMRVTGTLAEWPEKGRRDLRWCSATTAAALVDEPILADLCLRLAVGTGQGLAA